MIALRPYSSSVTKWISSCASKSSRLQGVVIVIAMSRSREGRMGRPRGLEPPTPGTTNQCSNQLSYDRHGNASGNHLLLRFPLTPAPLRVRRERRQARAEHQCAESKPRLQPEIRTREHVASI